MACSYHRRLYAGTCSEAPCCTRRPGDIILATYPKSGTTWTQYTLRFLLNLDNGKLPDVPTFADLLTRCCPFLELVGRKVVEATPAPRVIKTHFSSTMTPYHPKAKYVIIVRNPFDCVVSFYHHCMGDRINLRMRADTKFDEFSEDFMDGYNFKSDPKKTVLALAKFVDASVWQKLRANKALLKVLLERISFANLKSDVKMDVDIHHTLVDRNHHEEKSDAKEIDEKRTGKSLPHKSFDDADDPARNTETPEEEAMVAFANFFRKGEVGDWKRYLNPEQEKRLRAVYEKRKRGTEMWDAWKDYLGYKDASARANKGS
nr:sulfotransferase family cytosolic 1B member 1-like [Rhipicephalus microplus]